MIKQTNILSMIKRCRPFSDIIERNKVILGGIILLFICALPGCISEHASPRPLNILWITSEDMNSFLGSFGDSLAQTPYLDQLAAEGVRYTHAFATAPVCSPARSCLITGVYASSLGTQHLRSEIEIPDEIVPFPKFLREAGYYCTNNKKEDYNFQDATIWDESSGTAHWRNRDPGQPFFSVFNFETTHQSRIFGSDSVFQERFKDRLPHINRTDPNEVSVPPYHFDTPLIRKFWARYYDVVSLMDQQVGALLQQLAEDGLMENTLIFYYADHGTGMPRSKRALYDSGLRVPLIIKAPKHLQEALGLLPGTTNEGLVSFADFPPTLLSILEIPIPSYMQGIPFLGPQKQTQEYVYGHADRVDEAYELSRTVRGPKYRYIRNYYPYLPLIQKNFYTDQSEIMQALYREKERRELTPAQEAMWAEERPTEELYDTERDPFETHNLAEDPSLQEVLQTMRRAQVDWELKTYDSGLIPEPLMHRMAGGGTIYELLRDSHSFPQEDILRLTNSIFEASLPVERLLDALQDSSPLIRFWALNTLQSAPVLDQSLLAQVEPLLSDEFPSVSLMATHILGKRGKSLQAFEPIKRHLLSGDKRSRLLAARTFELLIDQVPSPIKEDILAYFQQHCPEENWQNFYELYTCWALGEGLKDFN